MIAKLDRLARNAAFLLSLRDAGVEFVACDLPEANRLMVGIMAMIAEHEAEMISARTKAALAAARARGTVLGGFKGYAPSAADRGRATAAKRDLARRRAAEVMPAIAAARASGATSLRQLADRLNARGVPAARGGAWHPGSVRQLLRAAP